MSLDSKVKEALSRQREKGMQTFSVTVTKVNEDATVDVEDLTEFPFMDVRLKAAVNDEENTFIVFPKVGSQVLVTMIGNDLDTLFVSAVDRVERIAVKIDNTQFDIDTNGFLIKHEDENLRKLMLDLVAAIRAMKFTTNNGPTINLINDPEFEALLPRFKSLLKDS